MALIYDTDLDILRMYLRTKSKLSRSKLSKVWHYVQTDRETDATERITTPHSPEPAQTTLKPPTGGHGGKWPYRDVKGALKDAVWLLKGPMQMKTDENIKTALI